MESNDEGRLMHDHAELGDLLGQLIKTLDANDLAQSYANLDLFWARLAMHIRAEHLHLFPAISHALTEGRKVDGDSASSDEAQSTIEALRHDHDFFMRELSQAIAILRNLTANPGIQTPESLDGVREKIMVVRSRLARHNEIEEQGIYRWTSSLLDPAERKTLAAHVDKELKNVPPRFHVE